MTTSSFPSAAFDRWQTGRDEIEEFYRDASSLLGNLGCEYVSSVDEIDAAIEYLKTELITLENIRADVAELEKRYPAEYEPDYDEGWDS